VQQNPAEKKHGQEHEHGQHEADARDEEPTAASLLCGCGGVSGQQSIIAPVGAPADVEEIAQDRQRTNSSLDGDVHHHAGERNFGDASVPGREDDDR